MGLPWDRVVELALAERSRRPALLGHWGSAHLAGWGADGPTRALRALRAVAVRLGRVPTPFEYDHTAQALAMESQRRTVGRPLLLPSSAYVLSVYGTWQAALQDGGLEPRPPAPVPRGAPSLADSLDAFIEEFGVLPSSGYFLEWCRRLDIPTTRVRGGWATVVTQVRDARVRLGVAMPAGATAAKHLLPLPAPQPRQRRIPFRHSRAAILASLRRYGARHLAPGALPRQKHYLVACRTDAGLIWPGRFSRHGRFHDLCREAGIE